MKQWLVSLLLVWVVVGCGRQNEPDVMDETTPAEKNPIAKPIPPGEIIDTNFALNQRIASRLSNAVTGDIVVDLKNGVVILRGTVSSAEEKQKAQAIVENMTGVGEVRNELQVQESPQQ